MTDYSVAIMICIFCALVCSNHSNSLILFILHFRPYAVLIMLLALISVKTRVVDIPLLLAPGLRYVAW